MYIFVSLEHVIYWFIFADIREPGETAIGGYFSSTINSTTTYAGAVHSVRINAVYCAFTRVSTDLPRKRHNGRTTANRYRPVDRTGGVIFRPGRTQLIIMIRLPRFAGAVRRRSARRPRAFGSAHVISETGGLACVITLLSLFCRPRVRRCDLPVRHAERFRIYENNATDFYRPIPFLRSVITGVRPWWLPLICVIARTPSPV